MFCHLMKNVFLKMSLSFNGGKDEKWYHENGKNKISQKKNP